MAGYLFTSNGTWTCPDGYYVIDIIGCGGGNAGHNSDIWGSLGGAGGDGATQVTINNVPVTPGTVYTATIGAGGAMDGYVGDSTIFTGGILYIKIPGGGGLTGGTGGNGTAGSDGSSSPYSFGGKGGQISGYQSGGGGGGGAGKFSYGGNGGHGAHNSTDGIDGANALANSAAGGGGGGSSNVGIGHGGAGGSGYLLLVFGNQ